MARGVILFGSSFFLVRRDADGLLQTAFSAAPSLDAAARARLGAYLRVAFAHLERHELTHLPESSRFPEGASAYGLCDGADARALFYDTVRDVIVPRLEEHGVPAAAAWKARAAA